MADAQQQPQIAISGLVRISQLNSCSSIITTENAKPPAQNVVAFGHLPRHCAGLARSPSNSSSCRPRWQACCALYLDVSIVAGIKMFATSSVESESLVGAQPGLVSGSTGLLAANTGATASRGDYCSGRAVRGLLFGQGISVLVAGTGIFSQYLARRKVCRSSGCMGGTAVG